jgi:hypothetical protein
MTIHVRKSINARGGAQSNIKKLFFCIISHNKQKKKKKKVDGGDRLAP